MKRYYIQAFLSIVIGCTLYLGMSMNDRSLKSTPVLTNIVPANSYTNLTAFISTKISNNSKHTENKITHNTNAAPPIVDFNFNNDNTCSGTPINFNAIVTGEGPFNYLWDFGDGNTSTLPAPSHVYTALGCGNMNYSISLIVTDKNGETNSTSKTISVKEKPKLEFIDIDNPSDPFNNCGFNTSNASYTINVGISDASICINSYTIDWGDGSALVTNATFPASHTYTQLGSYNMKITGHGTNCNNEVTYLIKNSSNPTGAIVSPGSTVNLCTPVAPLIFAISTWGENSADTTYEVDFGDGNIEVYTQAQLEASSYYNSSDPANSDNYPIPHTYTASNCPNNSYQVALRIATSCNETLLTVGPISILEKPESDFEMPDIGCTGTLIQFDNKSSGYNQNCNPDINYYWDFGDGNTSNLEAPTHKYALPGIYTVSLYSESFCGTSKTQKKDICIEPPLIPNFTLDNNSGCTPFSVKTTNTTDLSSSCGNETYLWEITYSPDFCATGTKEQWSFENGTDQTSAAPEFNLVSAGTYTLKLTATNSCGSNTTEQTIIVTQPPTVEINPINDFCGSATIAPTATVNGCAPASEIITYQWNFPGGSPATVNTLDPGTITYSSPGNYAISLSVTSNCGTITDTQNFEINEIPTISNTNLTQIICSGTETDEINFTSDILGTTYEWVATSKPGVTGFITSGTSNIPAQTINNTNSTSEIVIFTVTPILGDCKGTPVNFEITVDTKPVFIEHPHSELICTNGTVPTITPLSVTSNGPGTPTYQWYSNTINDNLTGTIISGATNSTYTPNDSNIGSSYYYCIASYSSGSDCNLITSNTAEIKISQPPNISNKTDLICSESTFTTTPNSSGGDIIPIGTTYKWSSPKITPTGSITGAIEENTPQTVISQTLTNITTSPATVTYTVTPTSTECTGNTFNITVTVNPSINITYTQANSSCYASNSGALDLTSITGGVPFSTGTPYKISWKGPNGFSSNSEDISNLEPGDYSVEILDKGGCPFKKTFTITEPQALAFSNINFDSETISCHGANDGSIDIEVSGGSPPYSYTWTKNNVPYSNSEDLNNAEPGTYEVSVTDSNNCKAITQEFTMTEPALLEPILVSQVDVICFGEATGEININTTGGRPTYSYAWQGPNGFTSTNQNLTGLYAGTYNLTVTDRSNCTKTLEVILKQNDDIVISYTATEIKCFGDNDASITINNITGGSPPYSVTWSNLGTGYSQTSLSSGTYIITVTDNENCTKEETVTIADVPIYKITPDVTNVSCYGANDARIVLNLVGGIAPVTLNWDDDPTAGVERNNIGPGSYTVSITDGTPCVITETFVITEPDELKLFANITNALDCDDANSGAINLIVTGGTLPLTYLWSNGETSEDLSNIPPGNYAVTVTDANNCEVSDNWDIPPFAPLEINITTETDLNCDSKTFNQSFIAEASGGVPPYTYSWSSGTVSGANGEIMNTTFNGLVIVEVTDKIGCSSTISYNVENPILGEPDFNTTSNSLSTFRFYSIHDPIQFTNTSTTGFISVSWDFGDGNFSNEEHPEHTYLKEGTYTVTQTVTYALGCSYSKTADLIITKGYKLIMPNAFTPNKDAINPYFAPETIALSNLEFNIFDTWGSLIYSEKGEDHIQGWNGDIRGNNAENGNYYFTFKAQTFYGETITRKGKFTSIK